MIQGMDRPAKAEFVTTVEATSFQDACDKFYFGNVHYDSRALSVWNCRLFETEEEARESFG